MIAAIREMAEKKEAMTDTYTVTADYLKACSMIFERGILSHEKVMSVDSTPIANMRAGMKWFSMWKEELQEEPGT